MDKNISELVQELEKTLDGKLADFENELLKESKNIKYQDNMKNKPLNEIITISENSVKGIK